MKPWWHRLGGRSEAIELEVRQLIKEHGSRAPEAAQRAAKLARKKHELRKARHYTFMAQRVAEKLKSGAVLPEIEASSSLRQVPDRELST